MSLEQYIKNRFSPTCQNSYLHGIKRYLAYTGANAVNGTYQDVLDFIAYLRATKIHAKTLMNYLFSVKIYYQWLLVTEQRDDHPCKTLYLTDRISKAIPVETLYSEAELLQLLETNNAYKSYHRYRNKVMISMFIYQAITPRELVNITLEELDLEKGTVHIKYSNPKQDRTLALQSNQILLIYNYLNIERPILQGRNKEGEICNNFILNENGKSLFPNCISRLINQNRSKEDKITPFKIRQSAIKNLLKKGNDLRIVQVFAGHRRSSSTEAYKQTGLEELKNVIQKYHPLA